MPERPLTIGRQGQQLMAMLHIPAEACGDVGVIIVVGGPQYRVGSHRQFVLLARALASQGMPALRFDYGGMGDSDGPVLRFDQMQSNIRAAVDQMFAQVASVQGVVLWGLCDGASAALIYAPSDPRIAGLVLANPWVRTDAGLTESYLRAYYHQRLFQAGFWRKILSDPASLLTGGRDFFSKLSAVLCRRGRRPTGDQIEPDDFLSRMLLGARGFKGRMLVLLSGNDLVATEFKLLLKTDKRWASSFRPPRTESLELAGASHTFASAEHRRWVDLETARFVRALGESSNKRGIQEVDG